MFKNFKVKLTFYQTKCMICQFVNRETSIMPWEARCEGPSWTPWVPCHPVAAQKLVRFLPGLWGLSHTVRGLPCVSRDCSAQGKAAHSSLQLSGVFVHPFIPAWLTLAKWSWGSCLFATDVARGGTGSSGTSPWPLGLLASLGGIQMIYYSLNSYALSCLPISSF